VNVADWNPSNYVWVGPGGSEAATSVARSPGWHEFKLRVEAVGFDALIDGVVVGSVAGDFTFDSVRLLLSGPAFRPDATFYFDDFNFTPFFLGPPSPPPTPAKPGNLVAISPVAQRVDLSWTDQSSDETRFDIAQDDSLGVVGSVGANVTTATFTGLSSGVSYHWYVRACNTAGCSGWFGPVGKTPNGGDGVPTGPGGLVATSPVVGRVDLKWTDNSPIEFRFEIAQDDSLTVVGSVDANVTRATFTGLNPGTSYHWYVRACNTVGCSGWFGPVGKTPNGEDPIPPVTPPGLVAPPRHRAG